MTRPVTIKTKMVFLICKEREVGWLWKPRECKYLPEGPGRGPVDPNRRTDERNQSVSTSMSSCVGLGSLFEGPVGGEGRRNRGRETEKEERRE